MQFSEGLQGRLDAFKQQVYASPLQILDPEGWHHELASGSHASKLDYDKIKTGTQMYEEWVNLYVLALQELCADRPPNALVGVANGTNRVAESIGQLLTGATYVETKKLPGDSKTVYLTESGREFAQSQPEGLFVITEDVGTTGGTTVTVIDGLVNCGVQVEDVLVVNWHQRSAVLPRLVESGVRHEAVILDPLPMYTPERCAVEGLCSAGSRLIRRP